jgi:hypothetical protein
MNGHDEDRMKQLLQQALPPVEGEAEPERDLWPAVLLLLDAESTASPLLRVAWFDWALLAGLVGFAAFFPASIPVLLYCL